MTRRLIVAGLAIALTTGACLPAPKDDDEIVKFETDTAMGEIQKTGTLTVGIDPEVPPWHYLDEEGEPAGLAVDLGREVAEALGVDVEFVTGEPDELLEMVESEAADVVFPSMAITEDGVRTYSFTDPYYVAHQRLLVPSSSTIDDIADLGDKSTCSSINLETGVPLDTIDPDIPVTPAVPIDDCISLLEADRVAAVTAPDVVLIEAVFESPALEIVGEDLTTEGYGAVVRTGASQFVDFVNAVWDEAKDEGRWMTFYDRWIAPHTNDPVEEPPAMTVEEAAALFPAAF